MKDITPKQTLALTYLLGGKTIEETAKEIGCSQHTIDNWLRSPLFKSKLNQGKEEIFRVSLVRLSLLTGRALDALGEIVDDPSVAPNIRVNAAKVIIENLARYRNLDLGERLAALERGLEDSFDD